MNMLAKFQQGELPIFYLNYGTIVFLPKKENAIKIEQYSHIGLFVCTQPTQTTFMLGGHILEGVLILHEIIHKIHWKKMDGVLLSLISRNSMIRFNG
jgi:hypothetical protein